MVSATNLTTSEKSAVQVALRIRPLTEDDFITIPTRFQKNVLFTSQFTPNQVTVTCERKQNYTFDYVFGPEATQKEIFDKTVKGMVDKFTEGYNVTILAYGQTSSGKTHTMGTIHCSQSPDSKGIIPRSMDALFTKINSEKYKKFKFTINVSFVEVHNEDLIDLLAEEGDYECKPQVTIREDTKGSIILSGLQEINVNSEVEVMNLLARGSSIRHVGATDMNSKSSRSHAIFSVILSQQKSTNEGNLVTVTSKFHFVDLAGSERLKRTSALGDRIKEGICINSGLLALGNVISALGDPSINSHIPYRDSKLTRLLQDSLGGNAQTLMIACVTPAEYNIHETINTLKYANRARNIKNNAKVNLEETGWNDIENLQRLVLKLRTEIKAIKSSNEIPGSGRNTPMSPLSEFTSFYSKNKNNKDVEELEKQLQEIQNSYTELSGKYSKASEDIKNFQKIIIGPDQGVIDSKKDMDKIQESINPIISKYEKTIGELQNELSSTRKVISETDKLLHEQEIKLLEAEDQASQSIRLINDLKNNIQNYNKRNETTNEYIKDLEKKLNSHADDQKRDQEIINELKERIAEISSTEEGKDLLIQNIEKQVKISEANYLAVNKTAQNLERALHDIADSYIKLEARYKKQKTNDKDYQKILQEGLNDRDDRISQLEDKVESLVNEISRMKKLKEESNNYPLKQQSSISTFSSVNDPETPSSIFSMHSKRTTIDYSRVSLLESQIYELKKIHENTISEYLEIKQNYEYSLNEVSDLQAKIQKNKESRDSFSSHRKSLSMTNEDDNQVLIQKLHADIRQLEMVHAEKARELDSVRKEFARLHATQSDSSEVVEELREEIKRRDGMAQVKVMSVMTSSECVYPEREDFSVTNSDIDTQEIINRLREEVEQLKCEQKRLLDTLSDNQYGYKGDEILEIESQIDQLKIEMSQAISERDKLITENSSEETINLSLSQIKVHEDQLIKAFEARRKARVKEAISSLGDNYPTEFNDGMLRHQINKLDIEIESKSHTIAALLYPSIENQNVILKLEEELFATRETYRLAIAMKNGILNSNNTQNVPILNFDEKQIKEMEEKIQNLEFQLRRAQKTTKAPTPRRNSLMLLLDTPTHKTLDGLKEKLSGLQDELISKSESEENLQTEQEIIFELQNQLESLGSNIQQKNELIDLLKENLEDKNLIQQKLKEKEAEALSFRTKLIETHNKETELRDTMNKLHSWNIKLENEGNINNVIGSELKSLKKELLKVKSRETETLERIHTLKYFVASSVEDTKLQEQIEKLRNIEIVQREKINVLERKLANKGEHIQEDLLKTKIELALSQKSQDTQKSTIQNLEKKLKDAEDKTQIAAIKQEINNLKAKESEKLQTIQLIENKLYFETKNSQKVKQVEKLNEEIEKLHENEREQNKQLDYLQIRLELVNDENLDINSLKSLINDLKISDSKLQKTLQHLENKYATKIAVKELSTIKGGFNLQQDLCNSLEEEVGSLRRELASAKYNTNSSTEKDKIDESLNDAQKEYDNTLKCIKTLENELEKCKNNGTSDKKVETARSELVKAKLEIVKQNEMLVECESEMGKVEDESVQHVKRIANLTNELEKKEKNQKDAIKKLDSTLNSFKTRLLNVNASSKSNNININKFEKIFEVMKSHLKLAKSADESRVGLLCILEDNLKELTKLIISNEQEITNQNAHILELDDIIRLIESELKQNSDSFAGRIRHLEAKLIEVNSKSQQNEISADELKITKEELKKVKSPTIEYRKQVKEIKSKLRDAKQRRDVEHSKLKEINDEIYILKEEYAQMQNEKDDLKHNSVLDCYQNIEDSAVQELINQIKQTYSEIKSQKTRVTELEKITHYLETDKMVQIEHREDLEEELDQLQKDIETLADEFAVEVSKFEEVDKLSKKQKRRINELEIALEESKKLDLEILAGESTDPEINKLLITNKELQQTNENLNSKIVESEKRTCTLSEKVEKLEKHIIYHEENRKSLIKSLKIQIKELEYEKEHSYGINTVITEERIILDKRIAFLREQLRLRMTGSDENQTNIQISRLNNLVETLRKDISDFKINNSDKAKNVEQEITRLLEFNDQLERYKSPNTKRDSSNSIRSIVAQNDDIITEQHHVINNLKEKLSQLELQCNDESDRSSISSNLSDTNNKKKPSKIMSQGNSPTSRTTKEFSVEIQNLQTKIPTIESENAESKQQVEALEASINYSEMNLSIAKEQLTILQKEKKDFIEEIKYLKSQLNETQTQIKNTRTTVEEEQKIMESVLEEERKAKMKAEKARLVLENQMEQLINKKRRFMCF
ncbi:9187_t:CDS:2 [Diversispora eburnea]|uniref:9187_t:CDS:1 n=1 Tax=Diversispora eburnea TaxID=1213867 RepID=A0A9N8VBA9_9GLOM|nr:9187_t:CDS:2 [Diversispora eburnea]